MSLILLAFGILITGAGMAAIVFGVPMSDSALGQTLMMSGAIGAVGGPMLMGVGAVVTQLNAIADALRVRPAAQIPRLTDARQPSDGHRRPEAAETARPPDPRPPGPRLPESRPAEATPAPAIEGAGYRGVGLGAGAAAVVRSAPGSSCHQRRRGSAFSQWPSRWHGGQVAAKTRAGGAARRSIGASA